MWLVTRLFYIYNTRTNKQCSSFLSVSHKTINHVRYCSLKIIRFDIIIALFNENQVFCLRILNECFICICYMIILYIMYTKYTSLYESIYTYTNIYSKFPKNQIIHIIYYSNSTNVSIVTITKQKNVYHHNNNYSSNSIYVIIPTVTIESMCVFIHHHSNNFHSNNCTTLSMLFITLW